MRLHSSKQPLWHLYTLFSLLSLSFAQIRVPIRRDRSIINSDGTSVYFYSLVMDFPFKAVLSDRQLSWLAKTAYEEMMALPAGNLKTEEPAVAKRPRVMSVLRVDRLGTPGTTVYFASSMRREIDDERRVFMNKFPSGVKQDTTQAAELLGAAAACQIAHRGGHGHDLKCGEPLALVAFHKAETKDPARPWDPEGIKGRNGLMAAYSGEHKMIIRPCTVEGLTYGCRELLGKMGIEWVGAETAFEPVMEVDPLRSVPQICLGQ